MKIKFAKAGLLPTLLLGAGLALQITPCPAASDDLCSSASLLKQMSEIAKATQGPVGAAVMIVEGGEMVALHGQQHFPMQSVYKLPIAMAVLHEVDGGTLTLDKKVHVEESDLVPPPVHSPIRDGFTEGGVDLSVDDLLHDMIINSDGTASDVLLRILKGPERVSDYVHQLGVKDMAIATTENEMSQGQDVQYQNWATPEAAIKLLAALQAGKGLSQPSQGHLLHLLTDTPTGPHRIKGLLPPGTSVAHKTGTSGTVDGLTRATNDIGLVTLPNGNHLAIAVFVSDTKADEATRESVIAKIARAAWDCWARNADSKSAAVK